MNQQSLIATDKAEAKLVAEKKKEATTRLKIQSAANKPNPK
jgi:hypothetical protein